MPLTLVAEHLDQRGYEFDFRDGVTRKVFEQITEKWYESDPAFRRYLEEAGFGEQRFAEIKQALAREGDPLYQLWEKYPVVLRYFDDWVVVRPDETGGEVGEIILRPKGERHEETILWYTTQAKKKYGGVWEWHLPHAYAGDTTTHTADLRPRHGAMISHLGFVFKSFRGAGRPRRSPTESGTVSGHAPCAVFFCSDMERMALCGKDR